jgi:Fe-Mn family superoxide dismutase
MFSICATGTRKSSDKTVHQDHEFAQFVPGLNPVKLHGKIRIIISFDALPDEPRGLPALFPYFWHGDYSMTGPFKLAPLPWDEKALEPTISSNTISFHYHKHHQAYVDTLNKLVEKTKFADMKLEEIVRATVGASDDKDKKVFNNAGQVWNHDFYWRSLSPINTAPDGKLASAIAASFGDTSTLIAELAEAGKNQFGSGWAWLVSKNGKLSVEKTPNAESPMAKGANCLLTIDVWEHAYYLDYQNARPKYLEAVLGKILNWDYAAQNLAKEDRAVRAAAE